MTVWVVCSGSAYQRSSYEREEETRTDGSEEEENLEEEIENYVLPSDQGLVLQVQKCDGG